MIEKHHKHHYQYRFFLRLDEEKQEKTRKIRNNEDSDTIIEKNSRNITITTDFLRLDEEKQ